MPGCVIQLEKSSAHTQHGYSLANSVRNERISDCCVGVARSGYDADNVCRSVQVLLPRASTSGGHSGVDAEAAAAVAAAAAAVAEDFGETLLLLLLSCCLLIAIQSRTDMQERHLCGSVSIEKLRV